MPSVTVSLIAWNDRKNLLRCLASLRAQTFSSFEIIVVDNGSTDGSAEAVRREFPDVRLMSPGRNLGYAGAHNLAFAASNEPYFLPLNADVTLAPDFLAHLVRVMEEEPDLSAVSGKLLRTDKAGVPLETRSGRSGHRSVPVIDSAGVAPDRRGRFSDLGAERPDDGRVVFGEVFGVCGAAPLYRRSAVIDAVPDVPGAGRPFDEYFFAYYEDADLAWQLRRRGWRARIVPEAMAGHVRGGSGTKAPLAEHFLHRNAFWVLVKNARLSDLIRIAPGWVAYESVKLFQSLTYKPALWWAQWERLCGISAMWRRRLAIKRNERRPRLAPRPDFQGLERAVRDKQAQTYDDFVDSPYHAAVELRSTLERLGAKPGERVIDLGCGTGRATAPLEAAGAHAVGVDFSHSSLVHARARCPGARFVQADLTRLPFKEGSFDRAVSCQVLEHLPDPPSRRSVFSEAARVLRKEGMLVMTAYHDAWTHRPFSPREGQHPGGIYYHRFRPGELTGLLAEAFRPLASVGIRHIPARSVGQRLMAMPFFKWLPRFDRAMEGTSLSRVFAHLWLVHGTKRAPQTTEPMCEVAGHGQPDNENH